MLCPEVEPDECLEAAVNAVVYSAFTASVYACLAVIGVAYIGIGYVSIAYFAT